MTSIVDLRRAFFGNEEHETLQEFYDAGVTAANLLTLFDGDSLVKQAVIGQTDPLFKLQDENNVEVVTFGGNGSQPQWLTLFPPSGTQAGFYLSGLASEYGAFSLDETAVSFEMRAAVEQTVLLLRLRDENGANVFTVAQSGAIFTDLPTVDPAVAGQLWNDAGTVKVSAG